MGNSLSSDVYIPPSREYLVNNRKHFQAMLGHFADFKKMPKADFKVDLDLVDSIAKRVHQRISYYRYFHGIHLVQPRQAAMQAYWVLRYHPLRTLPKWDHEFDVNVHFAFYVLFAGSMREPIENCPKEKQPIVLNYVLGEYQGEYLRAFSEYDISKEAMMLMSDSIKSIVKAEIKNHA